MHSRVLELLCDRTTSLYALLEANPHWELSTRVSRAVFAILKQLEYIHDVEKMRSKFVSDTRHFINNVDPRLAVAMCKSELLPSLSAVSAQHAVILLADNLSWAPRIGFDVNATAHNGFPLVMSFPPQFVPNFFVFDGFDPTVQLNGRPVILDWILGGPPLENANQASTEAIEAMALWFTNHKDRMPLLIESLQLRVVDLVEQTQSWDILKPILRLITREQFDSLIARFHASDSSDN